jgi:hypothetical protein
MIVTTASKFTTAAIDATKIAENVRSQTPFNRYKVDLLAYPDVVDLLNIKSTKQVNPWSSHNNVFHGLPDRDYILKADLTPIEKGQSFGDVDIAR